MHQYWRDNRKKVSVGSDLVDKPNKVNIMDKFLHECYKGGQLGHSYCNHPMKNPEALVRNGSFTGQSRRGG